MTSMLLPWTAKMQHLRSNCPLESCVKSPSYIYICVCVCVCSVYSVVGVPNFDNLLCVVNHKTGSRVWRGFANHFFLGYQNSKELTNIQYNDLISSWSTWYAQPQHCFPVFETKPYHHVDWLYPINYIDMVNLNEFNVQPCLMVL